MDLLELENLMSREELAGYAILIGFGLALVGALRIFGPRRVLGVLFWVTFAAVVVACATLRVVAGGRRY